MAAPTAPPEAPPAAPAAPTNPESKQTINVVAPTAEPAAPPKPGSARDRMFADLEKRGKPASGQPYPEAVPDRAFRPPSPPADSQPGISAPESPPGAGGDIPVEPAAPVKKPGPWKLVDEYKAKVIELEKQLASKGSVPEDEIKSIQEKAAKLEARNKEIEDEIRFVNYRKSTEFKEKFEEPYHRAWKAALSELGELTVNTETGPRQMNEQDILQLVNLPLAKARELADEVFGTFANDVMAHRKQIKQLWDAQAVALEDIQKNGESREKERMEKIRSGQQQLTTFIADQWKTINDSVVNDETYGQYFKPKEGDEDGNARLKKGFDLVDQAWKENPSAPNLTPEERKEIIKRHAAVRNRAAAFGRLMNENRTLQKRIAELEAMHQEINGSTPVPGGQRGTVPVAQGGSVKDQMFAELAKRAK